MGQELVSNKGANAPNVFLTAQASPRFRNQDVWQVHRIRVLLVTLNILENGKNTCAVPAPTNRLESYAPKAHLKRTLVPSELMGPSMEGAVKDHCVDCCVFASRAHVVVSAQDPIEIRRRNPQPSSRPKSSVRSFKKSNSGV